jgi:hypothetical protein
MSEQTRSIVDVDVALKVTRNGADDFDFQYTGDYFDAAGNFDFTAGEVLGKSVRIHFAITADSAAGARFQPTGDETFWIIEKSVVGAAGCPGAPYQGSQFQDLATGPDRLHLDVLDINNDGLQYRYALRFDVDGQTVLHDPDGSNGNNH